MKILLPWLFGLGLTAGLVLPAGWSSATFGATIASASASGGAFDAVGIQTNPGVITVGNPLDCGACATSDPSPVSNRSSVNLTGDASFLGALAIARASARAVPGHLSVSVTAGASSSKDKQASEVTATASAEWTSRVKFNAPGLPAGTRVITHPLLNLEGDFFGTATGAEASGSASLLINDLSSFRSLPTGPHPGGIWGGIIVGPGANFTNLIPSSVRLTRKFTVGEFGTIGFRFTIMSFVNSDGSTRDPASAKKGTVSVTGDASRSLRWGGIESVTDEEGNPITDWSITSDDGFDFSQPFPVPEPSSLFLLSTILAAGLAARSQRWALARSSE